MRQQVLVGQVRGEEGGIVGVERDQEAGIEVAAQRMLGKGGADAGADVRGGVELERNATGFEVFNQSRIENGGDSVADALRADRERFPDGFGASGFAGVVGEP